MFDRERVLTLMFELSLVRLMTLAVVMLLSDLVEMLILDPWALMLSVKVVEMFDRERVDTLMLDP